MPRGTATRKGSSFKSEALAKPAAGFAAAAKNYTIGKSQRNWVAPQRYGDEWQYAAWDFYDTIGEYRYVADWVGSLISKATLFPAKSGEESKDPRALDAMASLFGGVEGQQEMLRMLGIQFTVAGEAYIIGTDSGGDEDDWYVVAASEMTRAGTNAFAFGQGSEKIEVSRDTSMVIRIWRPHPRRPKHSNSPSRAVLPILSEINSLTMHVAAQVDSRLTSAGMLILPSQISFPTVPVRSAAGQEDEETAQVPVDQSAQGFAELLVQIAETAIDDQRSASAKVPIVLQIDGDYIDKVQYLTFWSELDAQAIELRKEAIRRLALGLDVPPEALEGVSGSNHWAAWQADESAIKSHSEPLLAVIVSSLTTGYLRPVLMSMGMTAEEAQAYTIEADTSELRLRPNRSKEALELYNLGLLSAAATLRENGFDETDMMSSAERAEWLTVKLAQGQTTPELVAQGLQILGVDVSEPTDMSTDTHEARPTPSIKGHPVRELPNGGDVPQDPAPVPDDVAAAAEIMVFRALERAGNRLKQRYGGRPPAGIAAADLHLRFPELTKPEVDALMDDAWTFAGRLGLSFDCEALIPVLDSYTRSILSGCTPHSHSELVAYLATHQKAPALAA